MSSQNTEELIVRELRNKAEKQKPEPSKDFVPVSKDEALAEAVYRFKKMLLENQPKSIYEAGMIIKKTFDEIVDYFDEIGADVSKEELTEAIMKEVGDVEKGTA